MVLHLEEPLRNTICNSIYNNLQNYIAKIDIQQVAVNGISTRTNIVQNHISNPESNSKYDNSFNYDELKCLRLANKNNLLLGYININSIRNKIEQLASIISDSFDVIAIAETKLDETFPTSQFIIDSYMKPYRYDRNKHGGGLLVYVKVGIPSKHLQVYSFPDDIEVIVVEINLKKQKWLLLCLYRPPSQSQEYFFGEIEKSLDFFSSKFENFMLIGDLNCETDDNTLIDLMDSYNLINLVKDPTCYKSSRPRCIDFILTNRKHSCTNTSTFETGLSDFHKMIITVLKGGFLKRGPRIIEYRYYSKYNTLDFRRDINDTINKLSSKMNFDSMNTAMVKVLDQHAPIKKKYILANDGKFMTKELKKAIMHRSKLKNKFNRNRTDDNWNKYKQQRNKCVAMLRRTKLHYYKHLDTHDLADNRTFWKTIKPVFTDKIQISQPISLLEKGEIINDDVKITEVFNEYFANITDELGLNEKKANLSFSENIEDPIEKAVHKYKNHPSIKRIKQQWSPQTLFEFRKVTTEDVATQLRKLKSEKSSPIDSIPSRVLQEHLDIFAPLLQNSFNLCIETSNFPETLKKGNISSILKKGDAFDKKNYRPISILPSLSKIFERLIEKQVKPYTNSFLSSLLCGYREGYSTQHALLWLVENCKKALDQKMNTGAVFIDLSKAFDCLNHDLLIAKLDAYGFTRQALKYIKSYLRDRKQRVKMNGSYSEWRNINHGVPQGSVLGPLLFNIYINDLFISVSNSLICNYADDTTIYVSDYRNEEIIRKLEIDTAILSEWFRDNSMKVNAEKCHLMFFSNTKSTNIEIKINNEVIHESPEEKLLGIIFDKTLSFKAHVTSLYKKANQKLHALSRIAHYMDSEKLKHVMKAFILSQFTYCPLVWMLSERGLNNKINHLHEKALRIAYKDDVSDFKALLEIDNAVTIHVRNIQLLMTEIFKTQHSLNPTFMKEIFIPKNNQYALRNEQPIKLLRPRTTTFGEKSISFLGGKLWHELSLETKQCVNLNQFRARIKNWKATECSCHLCRCYVAQVGFI